MNLQVFRNVACEALCEAKRGVVCIKHGAKTWESRRGGAEVLRQVGPHTMLLQCACLSDHIRDPAILWGFEVPFLRTHVAPATFES